MSDNLRSQLQTKQVKRGTLTNEKLSKGWEMSAQDALRVNYVTGGLKCSTVKPLALLSIA